ncbi:MAG: hypothetical protein LH606_03710 [Cytophagaceae bacterium]|nr:hypothetical protein [Cytophagaceae bacterium]
MIYAKYISVALAAALKFVGGPLAGLALGLTWHETALCSFAGMMTSVILFTYLGEGIRRFTARFRKKKPRLFTTRNRRAVRIWQRFGLAGIACLTPLFFTPIGGTLLAVSFRARPPQIFAWMLLFGAFWGVVLTYLYYQIPGLQNFFGSGE